MIDPRRLLSDCQAEARRVVESLRERLEAAPALRQALEAEHRGASEVGRTGEAFVEWLEERLEQVAASWVLSCVFVRFLEDNELVETPRLSGQGDRLERARDEETLYFRQHPEHSAREYLEHVFRTTAALPGMKGLLSLGMNPLWTLGPTGDGGRSLVELWRRRDGGSGDLVHDFADPALDTRFLGDLYQNLSVFARERYALLQTPGFVEAFILDRTLEPAIAEFGLEQTTLIDPACGSGHFLLGAFQRLLRLWQRKEPATPPAALAQRALDQVAGVDLNPFAAAIARFRLLIMALQACGIRRLAQAPALVPHVAAGDSLLHGPRPEEGRTGTVPIPGLDPHEHHYVTEDAAAARALLARRYAVVVANPPYITPKDCGLNALYRRRFGSCHRQYSLAVPFKERCFDLVRWQEEGSAVPGGFVGMITANSFMKREFGRKLIEDYVPRWDLTHVIDTSGLSEGALVGHLTPTVILLARGRKPLAPTVRTVRSIRSEPSWPEDPASGGVVWQSITAQVDHPGSEDRFCSTDDTGRTTLQKHPWSLGGGGAAELKQQLEAACERRLRDLLQEIGRTTHTGEDNVFNIPPAAARTRRLLRYCVPLVAGEGVRDYQIETDTVTLFPYDQEDASRLAQLPQELERHFWSYRTSLRSRLDFGETPEQRGLRWHDHSMFFPARFRTPLSIAVAEIASHNHFALDRGGKVFNRTAPVLKLANEATEDEYLSLLGVLNSSATIFWLRQICAPKGKHSTKVQSQTWGRRFVLDGTKLGSLPVPGTIPPLVRELAQKLDANARRLVAEQPAQVVRRTLGDAALRQALDDAAQRSDELRQAMVALQEELDWAVYEALELLPADCPSLARAVRSPEPLPPSARPFEILLARKVEAGTEPPYWFVSLQRKPESRILTGFAPETRARLQARLDLIERDRTLALLESPECKRKWEPLDVRARELEALSRWMLDRLEDPRYWAGPPSARSTARLADLARDDTDFLRVAEVYRGRTDFDVSALVTELVTGDSVPAQKAYRYKPSGLRKREAWEQTWELQRQEDLIDARTQLPEGDLQRLTPAQAEDEKPRVVGAIRVPPKYAVGDFQSASFWALRGALDVPKERFVSLPGAERDEDPTPMVLWAGYDHLQQAQAIAGCYVDRKERDGWERDRLLPLLVALHELVPWLRQWHNAYDPEYGEGLGDYFAGFVEGEARAHGLTLADLEAWVPAKRARKATTRARKTPAAPPAGAGRKRGRRKRATEAPDEAGA